MVETKRRENRTIDVCKAVVCLFIAATHIPSVFPTTQIEVYFGQWFFRFCVPFFFACSGYFFCQEPDKLRLIRRMAWMTAFGYVLYLPQILEGADGILQLGHKLVRGVVLGYGHLWYLSAALEGMVVWYFLEKWQFFRKNYRLWAVCAVVLVLLGGLFDEHFRALEIPLLTSLGDLLGKIGGPRNVVFIGLPFLILGGAAAKYEDSLRRIPTWALFCAWFLIWGLALAETRYLFHQLSYWITMDLSFFGCWPGLILLLICDRIQLPVPEKAAKFLRRSCSYVYLLHPLVATYLTRYLPMPPLLHFTVTIFLCGVLYVLMEKQFARK